MQNIQNLHTHCTHCDGEDTPEQLIQTAIEKGFDSLGFSSHSYMYYAPVGRVTPTSTEVYKKDINHLKEKYKDIIKIYLGLEVDMFSEIDLTGFDYLIGSMHFLKLQDKFFECDTSAINFKKLIEEQFKGDGIAFAKKYYETVSELPKHGNLDIIGHFDIITKCLPYYNMFDWHSKEYLDLAFEAINSLKGKVPFFEVNTFGTIRGERRLPFPPPEIIKEFKKAGFGAVISSDCHRRDWLDVCFEEARETLKSCGYNERYILTDSGFKAVEI